MPWQKKNGSPALRLRSTLVSFSILRLSFYVLMKYWFRRDLSNLCSLLFRHLPVCSFRFLSILTNSRCVTLQIVNDKREELMEKKESWKVSRIRVSRRCTRSLGHERSERLNANCALRYVTFIRSSVGTRARAWHVSRTTKPSNWWVNDDDDRFYFFHEYIWKIVIVQES